MYVTAWWSSIPKASLRSMRLCCAFRTIGLAILEANLLSGCGHGGLWVAPYQALRRAHRLPRRDEAVGGKCLCPATLREGSEADMVHGHSHRGAPSAHRKQSSPKVAMSPAQGLRVCMSPSYRRREWNATQAWATSQGL